MKKQHNQSTVSLFLFLISSILFNKCLATCPKCGEPKTCRRFVNKAVSTKDELDTLYERATVLFNNDQASADDLRNELNQVSKKGHENLFYDCVWSALEITDRAPDSSDNVTLFYSQESIHRLCRICKNIEDGDNWNREHLWPRKRGLGGRGNFEHNDIHHLVPTDKSINGDGRNNRDFGKGTEEFTEITRNNTETNTTETNTTVPRKCDGCRIDGSDNQNGVWEPPDVVKGQVARMMLYMDVRYTKLELVPEKIAPNPEKGRLGDLVALLEWHCNYTVSVKEVTRNDDVERLQGNRNPFIDRPEFAKKIWPEYFDSIWSKGCEWEKEEKPKDKRKKVVAPSVWINEFHYDNVGKDTNEFIEIACNTRVDLKGYNIMLINGKRKGILYETIELSETCDPASNFVVVNAQNIQNGERDGIALVKPDGSFTEFISYEGTVTYQGLESVDIKVEESNLTPNGHSLQKVGNGCVGSDFMWRSESAKSSKGTLNVGQTLNCGEEEEEEVALGHGEL